MLDHFKDRSDLSISGIISEVGGMAMAMRVTVKTGVTYL